MSRLLQTDDFTFIQELLGELRIQGSTFQWLFALSRSWSSLTHQLSNAHYPRNERSEGTFLSSLLNRLNPHSKCDSKCVSSAVPVSSTALLRLRILSALASLAMDLGIHFESLGHLSLETIEFGRSDGGKMLDLREFFDSTDGAHQERSANQIQLGRRGDVGSIEEGRNAQAASNGLLLLFTRTLPRLSASCGEESADKPERYLNGEGTAYGLAPDWLQWYASRGFKSCALDTRLYDSNARVFGTTPNAIEKVMRRCAKEVPDDVRSMPHTGAAYISLVYEREKNGGRSILVYDSALYQVCL